MTNPHGNSGTTAASGMPKASRNWPDQKIVPAPPVQPTSQDASRTAVSPDRDGDSLLRLEQACFEYSRTTAPVLVGINMTVPSGQCTALIGESGSGKTTILRLSTGTLQPTSGAVTLAGHNLAIRAGVKAARRLVRTIYQDPYEALPPWMTALEVVAEAARVGGLSRRNATQAARQALAEVGLTGSVIERRPSQLSGGQCQRAAIAHALIGDPQLLVADEPTAALDVSVQAQILNLLLELQQQRGLTLLLVSHDVTIVRHLADDAYVLAAGAVVEHGPAPRVFDEPAHDYTRRLVDSVLPT